MIGVTLRVKVVELVVIEGDGIATFAGLDSPGEIYRGTVCPGHLRAGLAVGAECTISFVPTRLGHWEPVMGREGREPADPADWTI